MRMVATGLADLLVIERDMFADARGAFHEAYLDSAFAACGLPTHFPQVSDSRARRRSWCAWSRAKYSMSRSICGQARPVGGGGHPSY